ncbi:MAG: precorrin-6B C5,15-methyltransferase / cobalt-precorrin-6B C5,C15-methyltransferase [Oceanotoga sp.]|uniref:SAM-dependent methyltransferase n=1 Tax=Oceanotoga sp. TaxID=2108366 RepID=UPI0026502421|nr:SAM-dependent methyltransferase [Oceanotoga sp.]MDN5342939.1 precorrin-6B C5,15-methyltransferase / cobalt-precorrin-6B C5,C15-methyltransferase [Oceanotoga sp.]
MSKIIYILGTQINKIENLTQKQLEIIKKADFFAGFNFSLGMSKELNPNAKYHVMDIYSSLKDENVIDLISQMKTFKTSVLMVSGNPLMFSYSKRIMDKLSKNEYEVLISPSSINYLCQKAKYPMNSVRYISGHNSHNLRKTYNDVLKTLNDNHQIAYFVKNKKDYDSLFNILKNIKVDIVAGFELGTKNEEIFEFKSNTPIDFKKGRWILLLIPQENDFINLFPKNSDLSTKNIPVSREWSRFILLNTLNRKQKHDVIWDLGAGSGATSLFISSFFNRDCLIYAFEKDYDRFESLKLNTNLNPEIEAINKDFIDILDEYESPDIVHLGGGINLEALNKITSKMKKNSLLISSVTTLESLNMILSIENFNFEYDMYTKFSNNKLGEKSAFKGEHVFYCIRGEKND